MRGVKGEREEGREEGRREWKARKEQKVRKKGGKAETRGEELAGREEKENVFMCREGGLRAWPVRAPTERIWGQGLRFWSEWKSLKRLLSGWFPNGRGKRELRGGTQDFGNGLKGMCSINRREREEKIESKRYRRKIEINSN